MDMTDEKRPERERLDRLRHGEGVSPATGRTLRLLWLLRKAQRSWNSLWRLMLHRMLEGCGLEMSRAIKIGSGPYVNRGVPVTYADTSALERDFGYKPATTLEDGLRAFAKWDREYYGGVR